MIWLNAAYMKNTLMHPENCGRNGIDYDERVQMDVWYVRN